ncbi:androglobin [Polyergus mexicanus]|uniref:androglobin n=1 Tax=Polyergus mexicanus TaxID=615972 RepID=UPI0038B57959
MSEKSRNNYQSDIANASWPEWKDSDLNNEKWGVPKDGPDGLFLDTEYVTMPRSLKPDRWIRAKDLQHLTSSLTIYTTIVKYPDLIMSNKHLLHSEFIRWFISTLKNLQYCGREGLEISGQGSNFTWADGHRPWCGWMHVYSLNKAGKGVQHRPVINPNGKYIVRLHHMGCWRRILVDDNIPVDKNGRPLLPCTSNNFELWPMLLAKALLKVASLTWTERREIIDFHPIACLTGWIFLTLDVTHLSSQDKWNFLMKYSEHFEWTSQTTRNNTSPESSTNSVMIDKTRRPGETSRLVPEAEKLQPITLFLLLANTRELGNKAIPGLSPCWDHVIYVVQSRDVPLDPKDVKPPLAKWKLHRWLKWAISQNVIDPVDYFVPIRYLRVISPFEECDESVVYIYDESDAAGNSNFPTEIEQSDKSAWRTQRASDSPMTEKEATEDVSRWIDFNMMAPHITEVYLFYKLEYLRCTIQVMGDMLKTTQGNRKTTNKVEKEKTEISNASGTLKSRNKSLYLFCDSLENKFFLVNFCAASRKKKESHLKDYLILEKYNWFFGSNQLDKTIIISTFGNKSTVVELKAGRQLLRIYRRSESSLAIISSDTDFYLGNRATVQQLMTTESDKIEWMSKIISNSLSETYRSFGTNNYPVMLKNYYRSYMPDSQHILLKEDKNLTSLIHQSFIEEQVQLIRKIVPDSDLENILRALRIFFLNPNITSEYYDSKTQRTFQDLITQEAMKISRSHVSDYNKAATIIQSFFRMVLVKRYKQLHNPDHALHMQIRKELLKISDLFIDLSIASQLLRNFINRHDNLRDFYPYSEDFAHVLNIQEFKGVLESVGHEQWFPIVRLIVNTKPAEIVFAAFELLIDLPRVALRVFNNQNGHEVTRIVNHVAPARYEYLSDGYTVFAYGWNEKQRIKNLDWAIRIITMKGEPMLYQLGEQQIKPPKLTVDELVGTYVPNIKNYISRWILRATSGSIVSIRLTTSYNLTKIRIRVTDEGKNILADVRGGSKIFLPLMILKHSIKNEDYKIKKGNQDFNEKFRNAMEKKKLYYIDAFVFDNSWPLTNVEWAVVNQAKTKNAEVFKTKMQSGIKVSSNLSTARKDSKQLNNNQALEPPYWILQIVTDARDTVEIYQDKKREQEIALLKESWWSKDPGRFKRGKELRETFLSAHALKSESEVSLNQIVEQPKEIKDEDITFCLPHARQHRTLIPPEFHHHLPALNLTKYVRRNEITRHLDSKMKNNDEKLLNQYVVDIEIHDQRNYSSYLENLTELINEQLQRYAKLFKKKEKNFWQRRTLVDAVYESRKVYIDSLTSEKAKTKEKTKQN